MRLYFLIISLLCLNTISAQFEADNWHITNTDGINFNNASSATLFNYLSTNSNATIANVYGVFSYSNPSNGSLQLYGSGAGQIFDKTDTPFPSLIFNPLKRFIDITSTPTLLCIPIKGLDSIFYIFHLSNTLNNRTDIKLYYTKVDLKLRGGLGEVIPGQRDIPLLPGVRLHKRITAILHCNKKDVWVIGHLAGSDQYFNILVKEDGTVMPPQYFAGNFIPYDANKYHHFGVSKASPRGDKLASTFTEDNTVEIFDFNSTSGVGTNLKTINVAPIDTLPTESALGPVGLSFSPSGQKFYIGANYDRMNISGLYSYLWQFDATSPTAAQLMGSRISIREGLNERVFEIQLANNGKIYGSGDTFIEINNPDATGLACNLAVTSFSSLFAFISISFPIFIESYFRYPINAIGNCQFQNMSFSIQNPIGVSSVVWDFGDPASGANNTSTSFNPTHIFSSQGSYIVKAVLQNANGCGADTIRKAVYAGQYGVNLGNDTSYCRGDSIRLRMHIPLGRTTWSTGSADTAIYITQPGTYWVRVNLGECVASDTIVVTENQLPQFSLGNDTIICNNANITLAPNPNYNNSTYLWSNATTSNTNTVNTAGLHWLQLTDSKGCKWRDSINLSFKTLPNYNLGNDTAICQKDTITLSAIPTVPVGTTSYLWNTGATTTTIKAFTTNTYWCDVNKEGCIYRDSINLLVKPLPTVNLGNDTTLCEDKTYLLNVTNPNSTYQWNNGTTNPTFNITQAGTYTVEVTMNNCKAKDTINVQYQLKPRFTLGADKLICPGLTFILDPQMPPNSLIYVWQDGSGLPTYTVNTQGLYYVDISNECGPTRDSILITKGLCKVYIPTAFTPNNDNSNDLFKVGGGEAVKDFKLILYNRWGQKVFETTNTKEGWNGTFQGKAQPTGTYIYFVSYKDATTNEQFRQKGTVMLLR